MSAAALLVATASACGSAKQNPHERSTSSPAVAAGVGHKWALTRVTATGGKVDVPDSINATFQLTSDGRFLGSDSVNALSGTYTATPTGFSVTSIATTLLPDADTDPRRLGSHRRDTRRARARARGRRRSRQDHRNNSDSERSELSAHLP